MGNLNTVRGFLLDMDGVLYRGMSVCPGARELIAYFNAHAVPYLCLTNNATRTAEEYDRKLAQLGIPVPGERVLGTAETTARWLARHAPGATAFVIGTEGLKRELRAHGLRPVDTSEADLVVVGLDPELTYRKLEVATHAIFAGARFVGTNPDATFPGTNGLSPGCGAILAALETATGARPVIIGKPEPIIFREALRRLGLPPEAVAMVGDRLDTDILGGQRMGLTTVLVLGGVTGPEELETSPIRPDYVFEHLLDLLAAWREGRA
ncbi:MAG: HAD-IIA family hydrolase [Ardenticatenia bacterium]|nr:HAD-IIA family hydrolase [Ardenticatenia bacterium]